MIRKYDFEGVVVAHCGCFELATFEQLLCMFTAYINQMIGKKIEAMSLLPLAKLAIHYPVINNK